MKKDSNSNTTYGRYIQILSRKIKYLADENLAKHNITLEQAKVLTFLDIKGDTGVIYQKEMEKEFGIRRSSVTNILQNMEKNGLVSREVDREDVRTKKVFLSEKGKNLSQTLYNYIKGMDMILVDGMDEKEKEMFLDLLKRALANIEESYM